MKRERERPVVIKGIKRTVERMYVNAYIFFLSFKKRRHRWGHGGAKLQSNGDASSYVTNTTFNTHPHTLRDTVSASDGPFLSVFVYSGYKDDGEWIEGE